MSRYNLQLLDASNERSSMSVEIVDFTAANFDSLNTSLNALRDAVNGITLGTVAQDSRIAVVNEYSSTPPANQFAQRENKWLVRYTDDVTQEVFTHEIPTADLAMLIPLTDRADLTNPAMQTFVTQFEATVRSPNGNAVSIQEIRFVARNI